MLFGIKYDVNKKGLILAGESMQQFGGAILPHGKCSLYFTNPIEAYLKSRELTNYHKTLSYKVYIPSKEERDKISKDDIVNTREEYKTIMQERTQKLIEQMNSLLNEEPQK